MTDPAEGPRQVGEIVEAGVEGMSVVSAALIIGAAVLVAILVWVVLGSVEKRSRTGGRRERDKHPTV